MKIVLIQIQSRGSEATFLLQVIKKVGGLVGEGIRQMSTPSPNKAGQHQTKHLFNRITCGRTQTPSRAFIPTLVATLTHHFSTKEGT